jgi:hypothetical protein
MAVAEEAAVRVAEARVTEQEREGQARKAPETHKGEVEEVVGVRERMEQVEVGEAVVVEEGQTMEEEQAVHKHQQQAQRRPQRNPVYRWATVRAVQAGKTQRETNGCPCWWTR